MTQKTDFPEKGNNFRTLARLEVSEDYLRAAINWAMAEEYETAGQFLEAGVIARIIEERETSPIQ